jgi:uncharacterized phage protein (TIGR01671 family)|nr:MAG TPA: YopX protein [Caudoviricetes sp.]
MREILFKAKRKDNGEWVEGYYCKTTIGNDVRPSDVIFVPFKVSRNEEWGWMKVDSDTLCQYTGLTDKNGNKIWENDIISINAYSYDEPEDDYFGVVKYCEKDACWVLKNNERFDEIICECFGSYTTQMINHGNIFDNPELLEVEAR